MGVIAGAARPIGLPAGRVVVTFTFPDERPGNRRYWLLVEHRDAEVCYSDPGGNRT